MALTVTPPAWGQVVGGEATLGWWSKPSKSSWRPARWSDLWFAAVFEP
ncbi:hypothetical protein I552_0130 [Mycobacterium xenopi 3993]|nr:hypothetical protein I552_0130 [Mycobacterium xenopi 3993]